MLLLLSLSLAGTLPVPLDQPPASYPPVPLAEGRGARVLLEIDVAETGAVLAVRVVEGAGEGFDEAAMDAVRRMQFTPATDDAGVPVGARIQYAYVFVAERAAARSFEGTVRAAGGPVAGISVRVVPPGAPPFDLTTDAAGAFSAAGLLPGTYQVGVAGSSTDVEVRDGAVAIVPLTLAEPDDVDQVVVVEDDNTSPEVTERTLSPEEVRFLPGTGGDVVKVVQNLPGVARAPLGVGQLIIRGTSPEDSAFFLDSSPIPIVFHFSGLSTVLNGDFIEEVAYLPGNYGVRYGRALGGIVDLRTRAGLPEESGGYVSLDLYQGTAFVEQRVGKRTAIEASLRRSWIDAVLTPILSTTATTVRAPQYWDAQARVVHSLDSGGTIEVLGLFSADRFRVVGEEDGSVAIGLSTTFGKARARWQQGFGEWSNDVTLALGPEVQAFAFDGNDRAAYDEVFRVALREEVSRPAAPGMPGWRFGADIQVARDEFRYDAFGPLEAAEAWRVAPALYVEPTVVVGRTRFTPGLRGDALLYDFGYTGLSVDPRLGVLHVLTPRTTLKAGVGRHGQFPTSRQLVPSTADANADGNPDLHPAWAVQASVGVEVGVGAGISLEATAFYNRLYDLVVGREDRLRFFTGPPPSGPFDTEAYANEGTGRVCGVEVLGRLTRDKTLALLAGTFSNSARTGRDGVTELFEYDQPYVINGLVSQELPRGWRLGGRGRVSAGVPYTPVANRVYDMATRTFLPVYGDPGSARLPPFWSVDVRVDKEWTFRKWTLTTYLDVQNVFNAQNPEVMSWSYDYGEEEPISGLPVFPAFGVRGEW